MVVEIVHFIKRHLESHSVYKLTEYKEAIIKADIVVFLVAHKEFLGLEIKKENLIVI